jgi:cell division protein ZapA (FtsZ GTPase activity inhibitor)
MNVQIVIRGRQFHVRTPDDGKAITEAAADLDQRLEEQADRSRSFDDHSVIVITALNLISEMQMMRQEHDEQLREIQSEVSALEDLVASLLKEEEV